MADMTWKAGGTVPKLSPSIEMLSKYFHGDLWLCFSRTCACVDRQGKAMEAADNTGGPVFVHRQTLSTGLGLTTCAVPLCATCNCHAAINVLGICSGRRLQRRHPSCCCMQGGTPLQRPLTATLWSAQTHASPTLASTATAGARKQVAGGTPRTVADAGPGGVLDSCGQHPSQGSRVCHTLQCAPAAAG